MIGAKSGARRLWASTAIILIAAAFRFLDFGSLPPGLYFDESADGVDALHVLAGLHPIFFVGDQGREPLFIYLEALSFASLGPSPFALRLPAAFLGVLTVAVTYALFRSILGSSGGLIGAALLAVLFWHVNLSRIAFRAIALPLFLALAAYWLWRGARTGMPRPFVIAGAALGLSFYTYIPSRLAIPLVAVWAVGLVLVPGWRRCSTRRMLAGALLLAGSCAVICAPLAFYFALHPQDFFGRMDTASALRHGPLQIQSLLTTIDGLLRTGDPIARHDLTGRPLLDPVVTISGLIGAAVAGARRQFCRLAGSLFWIAAMLAPAALSAEPAHALRLIGELPFILLLPAAGFDAIRKAVVSRWVPLGTPIVVLGITAIGVLTARDYFVVWGNRALTYDSFLADHLHAMDLLPRVPTDGAVLVTSDVYEGEPVPLRIQPRSGPPFRIFDGRQSFVLPTPSSRPTYLLYARVFVPAAGVPGGNHLTRLAEVADPFKRDDGFLFRVDPGWSGPLPSREIDATVGGVATIRGADVHSVVRPGEAVPLALYWTVQGTLPPGNWQFFAHLVDRTQHHVLGESYSMGFAPDQWRSGDRVVSWFTLPVSPAAPATVADVTFGLFDRDTGARLPVTDPRGKPAGDAILVGPVRVDQPSPAVPPRQSLLATFGDAVKLDGYTLDQSNPSAWSLSLTWEGRQIMNQDYTVFVHALDVDGRVVADADAQPGNGDFPTSTWLPGEAILDQHHLKVDSTAKPPSAIEVGVYLLSTGQRLPVRDQAGQSVVDRVLIPIPRH